MDQVILDGFLPACEPSASPQKVPKAGIKEIGLAYEADPAVTRHLARFLRPAGGGRHRAPDAHRGALQRGGDEGPGGAPPNSGDYLRLAERRDPRSPPGAGARRFRSGRGPRRRLLRVGPQGGGHPDPWRPGALLYYIGVAASMPAVPGMPAPVKALCVAPFGMEEGSDEVLAQQEFALVVGEPVSFDFLASATRREDAPGTVVEDWAGEIEHLTTIENHPGRRGRQRRAGGPSKSGYPRSAPWNSGASPGKTVGAVEARIQRPGTKQCRLTPMP